MPLFFLLGNECRKTFESLTEEKKEVPKEKEKEKVKEEEKEDKKVIKKPSKAPVEHETDSAPNHKVCKSFPWLLLVYHYY